MKKIIVADRFKYHVLEIGDHEDINKYTMKYIEERKKDGDWKWYYTFDF